MRMEMKNSLQRIFQPLFSFSFFFSGKVVLSMRIFDEIEVATIATDKTTILEVRRSRYHSDEV